MAGTCDPIQLLQAYIQSGRPIAYRKNSLYFDLVAVPLAHPTAWKSTIANRHYSIGDIWLFLQHRRQGFDLSNYIKDCQNKAVGLVSAPDQDGIVQFFERNALDSECIDIGARSGTTITGRGGEGNYPLKMYEKPYCTKEMVLSSTTNFRFLLHVCRPYLNESKPKAFSQRQTVLESILRQCEATSQNLIIVVPSSQVAGNVSIGNVKGFLDAGMYQNQGAEVVSQPVYVCKQLKDRLLTFEIYDRVFGFTPSQWLRVVAVFVHGPRYQFKDWTGFQNACKIFEQVKGFYLKYQDGNVEEEVMRWAVRVLEIGRIRRHLDRVAQTEFWREMESFLWSFR